MSYYMRFISSADSVLSVTDLRQRLNARHSSWNLEPDDSRRPSATIKFGDDLLGVLEINRPGDGLFDDEVSELLEFMEDAGEGDRARVEALLQSASVIYAVQVLFGGRDPEDTLGALDILWEVLFEALGGLLQADGEGYYSMDGQVLEVS